MKAGEGVPDGGAGLQGDMGMVIWGPACGLA